ncbi:MAG: cytochrome b/b6 domain-containing protein [Proteobacteria bacterium]|nr:cytochrome b/b6 domain-containing protein [Pseudomonadota bacterium]
MLVPVLVWDLPIRLFHWLTVLLVAAAYATQRLNWMVWHAWAGTALLALVLFRLLWGVFGSETARFRSFVAAPAAVLLHLSHLLRREPDREVGHNAAGGWSVMLLIGLLLAETLTGLYVNNEIADEGPLSPIVPAPVANAIDSAHLWLWYALIAAVALHLAAVAFYAMAKGQNLVRPMVTGRKSLPEGTRPPRIRPLAFAAVLAIASAGAAALLSARL